jgi:ssDNA-binding Zn-finger/Zn-ribbon topoisomerase 1
MPQINNKLINQIIKDSGNEAKKLFNKCNNLGLPIKLYFSDNKTFDSCFIFIKIDQKLMKRSVRKPYYSDLLIAELVKSAKRNKCILVNSTSFGFPFSRIFKNSERYSNADSLRIAVGYDSEFNLNLDKAINEGIINFLRKYS